MQNKKIIKNSFSILHNISVKTKLILILFFPILGLLIFSSLQSLDYYEKYTTMQKIETLTLLSQKISKLVHEVQKERGLTAGYLGSKGGKFKTKLPNQRLLSNKRFKVLQDFVKKINFDLYPPFFQDNITKSMKKFEGLKTIRQQVDPLNISAKKAIAYYTNLNAIFLENVTSIAKLSSDAQISREILAYSSFLLLKERAGIERAVGASTLAKDEFSLGMRTKFINLITTQDTYLKVFKDLAKPEAKAFYEELLQGEDIQEVERIRTLMLSSAYKKQLVSKMNKLAGLGGILDNYRQYFNSSDELFKQRANEQFSKLKLIIEEYNAIGNISKEEKQNLDSIKNIFSKYNQMYNTSNNFNNTSSTFEANIKATSAFNVLSTSLFSDSSEYWFSQISSKINKLKKIDDNLSSLLMKNVISLKEAVFTSLIYTLMGAVFSLFVACVFGYRVSNIITKSLENFAVGLRGFFDFLNYKTQDVSLLNVEGKDEFAKMTKVINDNINQSKDNIVQDRVLINETIEISNRINQGHLDNQIQSNSSNPALNELKDILNNTISGLNTTMENIKNVLNAYTNLDYHPLVEKNEQEGIVEELIDGINILGESITKDLVINKNNGLTLEMSANTLRENVNNLTASSNEAAASLEETAAALEEIISTIASNSNNVTQMADYASKVTTSANTGEKLASNTMTAMDEINLQVDSINEAITMIDQIAFQTNILSLNAAVEAATAGEAGKGFAVVAQEVRNLANRSSEAAREIKDIVVQATIKAQEGKEITQNMLDGYQELNKDIEKTLYLINDIDAASKEQQSGIEQINDAVNKLDSQTQINAASAMKTNEIAKSTQQLSDTIIKEANRKEFRGKDDAHNKIAL